MLFSYNWLKDYTKKLPKPEKLVELLTMHSFEVEKVEKSGKDYALDVAVLPNRMPDCASHIGIGRECAAASGLKFQIIDSDPKEDKKRKTNDFLNIEVKNKNLCLRYTARVITGVKVGSSPKCIHDRLKKAFALSVVTLATSSTLISFMRATSSARSLTYPGSFLLPRKPSGDRKGASVSSMSLSKGVNFTYALKSWAFLYVILQVKEMKKPSARHSLRNSSSPEKQCTTALTGMLFFKISRVSFCAWRLCMTRGRPKSLERLTKYKNNGF